MNQTKRRERGYQEVTENEQKGCRKVTTKESEWPTPPLPTPFLQISTFTPWNRTRNRTPTPPCAFLWTALFFDDIRPSASDLRSLIAMPISATELEPPPFDLLYLFEPKSLEPNADCTEIAHRHLANDFSPQMRYRKEFPQWGSWLPILSQKGSPFASDF